MPIDSISGFFAFAAILVRSTRHGQAKGRFRCVGTSAILDLG
jgi:hypothetical protein